MSTEVQKSDDASSPASPRDDLPLFRFGLRQLLVFFTLICLLMAAMATWNGLTALVLLLAALVVVFHVFSTALGSQLRWHANRTCNQNPPPAAWATVAECSALANPPLQTRSPWHERRGTPLPWLARLIAGASTFGGIVGALLLSGLVGDRSSPAGIIVGSLSVAVVAGWFAFVGYSFYGVVRHGLRDALADDRRDRPR